MESPRYIVDTNVLMRRGIYEAYDEDYFSLYWSNFDRLVDNGVVISTPSVFEELEKLDSSIFLWAKNHQHMFKSPPDEKFSIELNNIKKQFPGWYNRKKEADLWADRDLVIYAKAYDLVLVTQESPNFSQTKQNRYKIPTICMRLNAFCRIGKDFTENISPNDTSFHCINFTELIRRENLHIENNCKK